MSLTRPLTRLLTRLLEREVTGGLVSQTPLQRILALSPSGQVFLNEEIDPLHWFDFVADRCLYDSEDVGGVSGATGYSFARASVGTYRNTDGSTTQFSSGQLRRGDRGVLIEGARTNLFLNSETGATQGVTVTNVAHTLSFEGTGTVTLTGTSTAGPLVGTGATDRVSLTFTPTAGTLTLTISGTVSRVNLEVGSFGSSWIPTAGTAVTREADVLTCTAGVDYPLTLWAEVEPIYVNDNDTLSVGRPIRIQTLADVAGDNNGYNIFLYRNGFGATVRTTVSQADQRKTASAVVGQISKISSSVATDDFAVSVDGAEVLSDNTVILPPTPELIQFSRSSMPILIRRAAIISSALTDAQLQAITT